MEKMKKIIGFDLDGVIIDHTDLKIKGAKDFGWDLTPAQTQSEIMKAIIPEKIRPKIMDYLYNNDELALASPLMAGAKEALRELKAGKINYFLISRRKNPELAVKLLERHGLWPLYFNDKNSFFVKEKADKNTEAKKLGINHYIDDEVGVLEQLTDVMNKFLFDPNAAFKDSKFTIIRSWQEFMEKVRH